MPGDTVRLVKICYYADGTSTERVVETTTARKLQNDIRYGEQEASFTPYILPSEVNPDLKTWVCFRFEQHENGEWIECADPRVVPAGQ